MTDPRVAALAAALTIVAVTDLRPARAETNPLWTWEDEERSIFARECLSCGRAGHYQRQLEVAITEGRGPVGGIYVRDGFVRDGHHRIVAAIRLDIDRLAVESKEASQARWIRDHGYVDWNNRTKGDR